MLTQEEFVEKIKELGSICPLCQSDRLDTFDSEECYGEWINRVYCLNCPASWKEVYKIDRYEDLKNG